jgi:signal transduction histidine kinase
VLFLLAGAAYANTGVLEERRRVACDIHDGVAQELSFIASQIRALPTREEDPETAEAATARTAATRAW